MTKSYEKTYKGGVQIIVHPSGLTIVNTQAEIKEHKRELKVRIAELQAEIIVLDKELKLCKGEKLIAKVIHFFRKDRIV